MYNTAHRAIHLPSVLSAAFSSLTRKAPIQCFALCWTSVFSGCSGVREPSFFPTSVPYVQYIKCTLAAQLKQLEISWSRKTSEKGAQSVWLQKCRNKSFGWWFYRAETKLLIRLQLCSSVSQACNQISGDKHLCFSRKGHCHVFCSMMTLSGGLGCWCGPTGCWRLLWCSHMPQILENPEGSPGLHLAEVERWMAPSHLEAIYCIFTFVCQSPMSWASSFSQWAFSQD